MNHTRSRIRDGKRDQNTWAWILQKCILCTLGQLGYTFCQIHLNDIMKASRKKPHANQHIQARFGWTRRLAMMQIPIAANRAPNFSNRSAILGMHFEGELQQMKLQSQST